MKKNLLQTISLFILFLCLGICSLKAQSAPQAQEIKDVILRGHLDDDDGEAIGFFHHSGLFWVSCWSLNLPDNQLGKLYLYRPDSDHLSKISDDGLVLSGMPTDPINGGYQNFLGFTSDGTYVYGVNMSRNIFVIDPTQYAVTKTIKTNPESGFTAIAYDFENEGFWCTDSNGNNVWFVDKQGNVDEERKMGTEQFRITGLAYDDITEGGPYLWTAISGLLFDSNLTRMGRFHIKTGEYEPFVLNPKDGIGFYPTYGALMGGAYTYLDYSKNKFVLAGLFSSEDILYTLDMGDINGPETPRIVENLAISSSKEDNNKVNLSWKNPTKTIERVAISSLTAIHIYRNNTLIHTIDNPQPGAEMSWIDTGVTEEGLYTYTLLAASGEVEGMKLSKEVFVGEDVPGAPVNVDLIRINSSSAKISWSAPASGKHEGWYDKSSLKYKITRMPDQTVVAENISATSYTDNSIVNIGVYSYTVTAVTDKGTGEAATSNSILFGDSMTIPWKETFENEESVMAVWSTINNDNDGYQWLYNPYDGITKGCMTCTSFSVPQNDDWLISPCIQLKKDIEYRLRFHLYIETETDKGVILTMGNTPTVEGQSTILKEYSANTSSFVQEDVFITVDESGEYYFGWQSVAGGEAAWINVADVSIEETPALEIAVIGLEVPEEMTVGSQYDLNIKVKNEGKVAIKGFKANLFYTIDGGEEVHISGSPYTYTQTLEGKTETTIPFRFTPSLNKEHVFHVLLDLDGDIDETNNAMQSESVITYSQGSIKKYVGDPNTITASQLCPFNFYYVHGAAQALYYQNQLGNKGLIDKIEYYYSFEPGSPVEDKPVKIYMAHTSKEDLYEGWISKDTVLVFDGSLDFKLGGFHKISIALDQPFLYNGEDNLLVYTTNSNIRSSNPMNQFITTQTNTPTLRANASNTEPFDFSPVGRVLQTIPNTSFIINELGAKLSGTVTDANGKPISGVTIGAAGQSWQVVTDAEGKYEFPFFPVLGGPHTLTASKPGYEQTSQLTINMKDKEDQVCDIRLAILSKGKLNGTVKATDNTLLKEANIILTGNDSYQVITDENGNYSIEEIYLGSYTLNAFRAGYLLYTEEVEIKNETVLEDIVLESCDNKAPINVKTQTNSYDWYTVVLTWNQPNDINTQQLVSNYNIYIDDLLVTTLPSSARKYTFEGQAGKTYKCSVSAIWNNNCESERETSEITITQDPWEATLITEYPWEEDFESTIKEDYWKESFLNASRTEWEVASILFTLTASYEAHSGDYFIYFNNAQSANNITRLISPRFDLTSLTVPTLKFWRYQAAGYLSSDIDEFSIWYKNSPEGEWKLMAGYPSPTDTWTETTWKLPEPTDTYWIAFESNTFFGDGTLLDDIQVYEGDDCKGVTRLKYTQLADTRNIKLQWSEPNSIGVISYTVFRGDDIIAEKITTTEYTDMHVPEGNYTYSVVANYDKYNCKTSNPESIVVTVKPGVGIDSVDLDRIALYPNPARSNVYIDGENLISIHVFNTLGSLIEVIEIDPSLSTQSINVSQLEAGSYLFKLTTMKGESTIRKMVIQPN